VALETISELVFHHPDLTTWVGFLVAMSGTIRLLRGVVEFAIYAVDAFWRMKTVWSLGRMKHDIAVLRAEQLLSQVKADGEPSTTFEMNLA
jgi:hypothetical protein